MLCYYIMSFNRRRTRSRKIRSRSLRKSRRQNGGVRWGRKKYTKSNRKNRRKQRGG